MPPLNLLNPLWAMYEPSRQAMMQQLLSGKPALIDNAHLTAGPANDAARDGLPLQIDGTTAIVSLSGVMMKKTYYCHFGTDMIARAIRTAAVDEAIETILLLIDSPGGSVEGTAALGDAIYDARQSKDVIAQVDGMACSAAYWAASQATRIVATGDSLIGSIGVRLMLYDFSQLFENDGIEAVPIDTGAFKSAGAMGTKITEEQRADFKRLVDDAMEDFVTAIGRGRANLSDDDLLAVADGRVFQADKEALGLGLIDAIGSPEQTLSALRERRANQRRAQYEKHRLANLESKLLLTGATT